MAEEKKDKRKLGNIRMNPGSAQAGLNLDSSVSQVGQGKVTYALNAAVENFDDNSVSYQNELGNELCLRFPSGYKLIGQHYIQEKRKHIFFLVNSISEQSEIGFMDNNDCNYQTLVNAPCLNFNIKNPIPKVVHRITNCTTEIYWTDGLNDRRYLDIEDVPYKLVGGTPSCDPVYSSEVDCNQLKIQPNFSLPQLDIVNVIDSSGNLVAGTYQFAVQYADASGNELTSYYSVTNPLPIADEDIVSVNFNYNVGKSIVVGVSNLDLTGQFQFFNIAVIKTINNVPSVELVGTYNIEEFAKEITYTGANQTPILLSTLDILEKFPYYDIANDVTAVQDVIVWSNLTSIDRTNYQSIASNIDFQWETYRIPPGEDYSDELNATDLRGYMRDEVYAFELVFLLKNGKQTDGFHIPGRVSNENDYIPIPDTNNDFIGEPEYSEITSVPYYTYNVCGSGSFLFPKSKFSYTNLEGETQILTLRGENDCIQVNSLSQPVYISGNSITIDIVGVEQYIDVEVGYSPQWKIYNTGSVIGFSEDYNPNARNYKGPYQYGELSYWESLEEYPCNDDVWGDLAGQKIRHHKFPDVLVSPIIENGPIIKEDPTDPNGSGEEPEIPFVDGEFLEVSYNESNESQDPLELIGATTYSGSVVTIAFGSADIELLDPRVRLTISVPSGDSYSARVINATNGNVLASLPTGSGQRYMYGSQTGFASSFPDGDYVLEILSDELLFISQVAATWIVKATFRDEFGVDINYSASITTGPVDTSNPNTDPRTTLIQPELRDDGIFPIGIRVDNKQIASLIQSSNLTTEQKADIVGFKIVRGDRGTNRSIVAKGMLRNVNKYTREEQDYYYPNYPYNDLAEDPFILEDNNAYYDEAVAWLVTCEEIDSELGYAIIQYRDRDTNKYAEKCIELGVTIEFCSTEKPTTLRGVCLIGPGDYTMVEKNNNCLSGYRVCWTDPFTRNNEQPVSQCAWLSADNFNFNGGPDKRWLRVALITDSNGNVQQSTRDVEYNNCGLNKRKTDIQPAVVMAPGQVVMGNVNGNIEPVSRRSSLDCQTETPQRSIKSEEANRQIFNSPETSFGQPFLGGVLKLESVMFGAGKAHFVEVKDNAKYKLLSKEAQQDALESSEDIGALSGNFNGAAMFTAYQSYLTIYINGITRRNYGMSFNSRASYDYSFDIENSTSLIGTPQNVGIKQREIDISRYLIPGVQSLGKDELDINNWNRESSVFIKTEDKDGTVLPLPLPIDTPTINPNGEGPEIKDNSRFTITSGPAIDGECSSSTCATPSKEKDISVLSYYASMKNIVPNQWGQIYSYQTIDTGYQKLIPSLFTITPGDDTGIVFGGDVFISKFAYKTKLPFFIDNRVNAPDDSDIFYDEIGNVGYPKYWHSARSILEPYVLQDNGNIVMSNIISYKAHNLDCSTDPSTVESGSARTFYDGYMYNFAYGVPSFYCESTYNTDLRQAFNNKEGDFWPHVSSGIPDDWVQETNVPIAQDNTYYYNVTFSKQNKENSFSHLPADWKDDECFTNYPFRTIYSDPASTNADNRVNNWLVYRALSFYDFPQNFGNLTSLDGIQNKAILARFENKSLLYNNLLTIDTSNPQAAYVGNPRLFNGAPPIDYAETDLGYVGSQNKFLLKIPQGQITADAKRGQIFLIAGKAIDLTSFNSGVNKFMKDELPFHILRFFPNVETDNAFSGIGLHGVYDSKFDRIIITKLDFTPLLDTIAYDEEGDFFYNKITRIKRPISLNNEKYFCNKSWTISYDFNIQSWISFHSYLPSFYIADNAFFYSGKNDCCDLNFDVIAGEVGPVIPITTTSTSTNPPLFTTTTSTTQQADCQIGNGIFTVTDCALAGTATIVIPPTTTACTRPTGLSVNSLLEGYQVNLDPPVVSTGSSIDACSAAALVFGDPSVFRVPAFRDFMYEESYGLNVGAILYDGAGVDCALVQDGWYSTNSTYQNGFNAYVFNVEDGVIIAVELCEPLECNQYDITGPFDGGYQNCESEWIPLSVELGNTVSVCANQPVAGGTLVQPSSCQTP